MLVYRVERSFVLNVNHYQELLSKTVKPSEFGKPLGIKNLVHHTVGLALTTLKKHGNSLINMEYSQVTSTITATTIMSLIVLQ